VSCAGRLLVLAEVESQSAICCRPIAQSSRARRSAELNQKLGAPVSPPRICAIIVDSYEVTGFARLSDSRASLWSAAYVLRSS
jgi:hypothetical protein